MTKWWGDVDVPVGEGRFWQIGPLRLWVTRTEQEWRFTAEETGDALSEDLVLAAPIDRAEPGPEAETVRFGFRKSESPISFRPLVADRPIVVKPETPFLIPPGEEFTLFVSTPAWLDIRNKGHADTLHERPLFRPKDTWFGPSVREGEMCYGLRTSGRFHLDNLPRRPHRVVSPVHIQNRARHVLALERLKLPVPRLSVFATPTGELWTQAVRLERLEEGAQAAFRLTEGPPSAAAGAVHVAGPRVVADRRVFDHAFGLLGLGGRVFDRLVD